MKVLRSHPFVQKQLAALFCCLFLFLLWPGLSNAEDVEVDYIALAKVLVKDGYYERAERTLKKISEDDQEDNQAVVASLWGMVWLHQKKFDKALRAFDQSLSQGLEDREIYLYRAEALLQLERLPEAQQSLDKTEDVDKVKLPFFLLQAELHWRRGLKDQAWKTLNRAKLKKLSPSVLLKKKFQFLMQEQLFLSAQDLAFSLLNQGGAISDVLAMASQLRVKGQHDAALSLLQALQVLKPSKEMVALEMAQNYLAKGEKFSAALVLEQAAKHNISLSYEAAEMLRQIGKSYRARFLNMSTVEPKKRLKQKLALFLEDDDYHSLKYMIPQLQKNKMLEDQEIRYAVAYSLFRTGDFEKSENYLNSIDKDGLFEKSIELKREISHCLNEKWACSETI